jgi:uncharacterized protein YkwD
VITIGGGSMLDPTDATDQPTTPTPTPTTPAPTSAAEDDLALYRAVNAFRASKGLPEIPYSPSLARVARTHVDDILTNAPVGGECNQHSWSTASTAWTGCCYTRDHAQAQCMWDKPKELTAYTAAGFEVAVAGTNLTPESDVVIWNGSDGHRAVLLNEDKWAKYTWRALGCAHDRRQAVCWVGAVNDPAATP